MSRVLSSTLGHVKVLRSSPGAVSEFHGRLDKSAPTADYWFQIHDKATEPTAGDDTTKMLIQPQKVQHTFGVDDFFEETYLPEIRGSKGIVAVLSTTEFTYTAAGAYAVLDGVPS